MLARLVSNSWPHDLSASAFQSAGITGVSHHAQSELLHSVEPPLPVKEALPLLSEEVSFLIPVKFIKPSPEMVASWDLLILLKTTVITSHYFYLNNCKLFWFNIQLNSLENYCHYFRNSSYHIKSQIRRGGSRL